MVSVRSELLVLPAELGRGGRPLPLVSLLLVEGGDGGHRHAAWPHSSSLGAGAATAATEAAMSWAWMDQRRSALSAMS